jgi:hypothetical protein
MGMLQSKRPGDKAVLAALALAVVASIYLLFYRVPADDRGEPWPAVFQGVAKAARERLTGEEIPDQTVSLLDASGPQIFLILALPIAVTLFAVWANRRPDRSRMLTFAMLAMAGAVILTGGIGIFYFPALIALAVGGFRVRKADLPARTAERTVAAGGGGLLGGLLGGRRGAIDAKSTEVTDDTAGEAGDAAGGDDEVADVVEVDPLAELEAELEAERAAEGAEDDADDGDTHGDGNTQGDGGSRRRR